MTLQQQGSKTADNGFEYLRSRFLKKNGSYVDAIDNSFKTYKKDDLTQILRSHGWSAEDRRQIRARINSGDDLSVWSGNEVFRPNAPRIIPNTHGTSDINNWTPSRVEPSDGDVTPFLDYVSKLAPNEDDQRWLLDVLAFKYQNPDYKQKHAIIAYSSEHGVGKSTLGHIITTVFGNAKTVNSPNALIGPFACPNWNGTWLIAEEIPLRSGGHTYNALKSYVTESAQQGQRKGQDWATFQTPASLLILSNYEPSFIEPEDRRFYILEVRNALTKEQLASYFARFRRWLEAGGYSAIAGFLARRVVSGYLPDAPPPVTAAKSRLIGLVQSGAGQDVKDWLEDLPLPVFTEAMLTASFKDQGLNIERVRHYLSGFTKHPRRIEVAGTKQWFWHREGTTIRTERRQPAVFIDNAGNVTLLKEIIDHDTL
jgi:hypothetical protein